MRTVSTRVALGLLLAGLTAAAAAAQTAAQPPDLRWTDWMGCWDLIADGSVARLPPAEAAKDGVAEPTRPGSNRSALVCVSPSQGGALLRTFVGGQVVLSQTIVADDAERPVDDGGCKGTQRARWSSDGRRLFTRANVACDGQPERTVTGLTLMAPNGEWVDVQAVTIAGTDTVRVRRYRLPVERVRAGVPAAAVRLRIDDIKEATKYVSSRAIEAALMETGSQFPLSGRALVDLDKAGVDDRVIDLMVALSYPSSFAVRPSGGVDDRLTPFPPFGGADFADASYDYPYFYGPLYSNYYYSPYFYAPFGYSYLRYYSAGVPPFAVIGGGAGGGASYNGHDNRPPENGRAINGLGYTRVDRRGDVAIGGGGGNDGGGASPRSAAGRGTVSSRGYSSGDAGGSSSSSSGGGSSSGGSSSSGSSGASSGGGDTGRTAVPR